MLGEEKRIREDYVETGQLTYIFWPVLNHGNNSIFAHAAMDCVAHQDAKLGWDMHEVLFINQRSLWSASRDFFVEQASFVGADIPLFEQCFDSGEGVERVQALDAIRRDRGVRSQPVFDVNGDVVKGFGSTLNTLLDRHLP